MSDSEVLERMRADWNDRAREDARYYVAFGRRGQQDEEFFASAADVVRLLEDELQRLPRHIPPEARRALEIGCGPGRLMRPMSRNFGEIHGCDVSDEMIRLARERFGGASSVHLHVTNGADLSPLPSDYFDYVYSYAVFQHIPSRDVVLDYFAEMRRVLKNGGIARFQVNGLAPAAKAPDTWEGVRFSGVEIAAFARDHDWQLLALEGAGTQYTWTTWRKKPSGWCAGLTNQNAAVRVRGIGNYYTGEPVVPATGRFSFASVWMEELPADFDLNHAQVTVDGISAPPCYVGVSAGDGLCQVNVQMPKGVRTGVVPVELAWLGKPLCPAVWLHVVPPGPAVPHVCLVSDGTNLAAGPRIETGLVKIVVEELTDGESITATLDGQPVEMDRFMTEELAGRFELNFRLPPDIVSGTHHVELCRGSRRLPPIAIEVA